MKTTKTILFPTDFSEASAAMAGYARSISQRFAASITVLHAFDLVRDYNFALPPDTSNITEGIEIPYTPALEGLRKESQERLEEFARNQFPNIQHVVRIQDGDPATVIECVTNRETPDLIMMATKGHGRFRRMLVGSLTAKVLHDLACPLFTSAHEPNRSALPREPAFSSIVCAVDLNQEASEILKAAALFSKTYGAKLCLVHIGSTTSGQNEERRPAELVSEAFQKVLDAEDPGISMRAQVCVLNAGIVDGVRKVALQENADLVVVGRGHERGNFSRIWSHLYSIIRESPCPVLSV